MLFNLNKTKGCLVVAMASTLSLLSLTALAEEIKSTSEDSVIWLKTAASDEVIEQGQRNSDDESEAAIEENESRSIPPDFSDLQKLRDFDHDLVDFSPASQRSYKQIFKDEVLAFCISTAYHDLEEVKTDALYTAAALHSWSRYELETMLAKVPPLITAYLEKPYSAVDRGVTEAVESAPEQEDGQMQPPAQVKLQLLKCIDLYQSSELEDLAKEHVIDQDRSYAEDHAYVP